MSVRAELIETFRRRTAERHRRNIRAAEEEQSRENQRLLNESNEQRYLRTAEWHRQNMQAAEEEQAREKQRSRLGRNKNTRRDRHAREKADQRSLPGRDAADHGSRAGRVAADPRDRHAREKADQRSHPERDAADQQSRNNQDKIDQRNRNETEDDQRRNTKEEDSQLSRRMAQQRRRYQELVRHIQAATEQQQEREDQRIGNVVMQGGGLDGRIPVFVFPSSLTFYINDQSTHKQIVTLYNPYEFKIEYQILCNAPGRYRVENPEGVIRSNCSLDIVVSHSDVCLSNVQTPDRLRFQIYEDGSKQVLGRKDVPATLVKGMPDPRSASDSERFESVQAPEHGAVGLGTGDGWRSHGQGQAFGASQGEQLPVPVLDQIFVPVMQSNPIQGEQQTLYRRPVERQTTYREPSRFVRWIFSIIWGIMLVMFNILHYIGRLWRVLTSRYSRA